jgi:hypothetical protein
VPALFELCWITYRAVGVIRLQIGFKTLQAISGHDSHAYHNAELLVCPDTVHERAIVAKELTDAGQDALKDISTQLQ